MGYQEAKNYAYKQLSYKAHTTRELRLKLQKKLFPEEIIQKVLEELTNDGYLNDKEWAESFIRGQITKNHGPKNILYKLRNKGISEELADQLVNFDSQNEQILKILSTKLKNLDISNPKERQRALSYLMRRGYEYSQIIETLNFK